MSGRSKILLTNFHLGTGGGHRTYLLSLLRGTLRGQFDLALACPASSSINSQARASGCLVFDQTFPGSLKNFFAVIASVRNLERIHRQFPFDIIHCNGSRDHWIAIYWKTFYRRAARIIRSRHAVKTIRRDVFHAWANNRVTALNIFVSRGMIPLCEPPGVLHLGRTRMIPNGIDTEYFAPRKRDGELAARLGIGACDFVVGSNAGLGTHKRADLMLKAIAEFPVRERIKILLLGEARSAGLYLQIAGPMGLEKNIVCPGMIDDVRPCLSLLDLGFVLSDSIETSSYAAKEMVAMGIPLICTRYSGLPENVDEGKSGFLIEPGDVAGLRKCLAVFLGLGETERAGFRAHARDKAVREFSKERQMELMAQAYREVCG
jgi:L-malate glycosyltransferase